MAYDARAVVSQVSTLADIIEDKEEIISSRNAEILEKNTRIKELAETIVAQEAKIQEQGSIIARLHDAFMVCPLCWATNGHTEDCVWYKEAIEGASIDDN
jgi:uncharacterized protein with PIN domain